MKNRDRNEFKDRNGRSRAASGTKSAREKSLEEKIEEETEKSLRW